ncbi:MAG: 50S ribosomal protein L25 [Patescibacteria group bacterium]
MEHLNLQVKKREVLGNRVRKLRREGKLPAVIYSNKVDPISIELPLGSFNQVFKLSGKNHVIDVSVAGAKSYPCIVHVLDIHPVTGVVRHVDFLAVNLKEKVVASVPITFVGESKAVKELGGILNEVVNNLEVLALPDKIPAELKVDISTLEDFNSAIRVGDLDLSGEAYEVQGDSDLLIVSITAPTSEVIDEIDESSVEEESDENSSIN